MAFTHISAAGAFWRTRLQQPPLGRIAAVAAAAAAATVSVAADGRRDVTFRTQRHRTMPSHTLMQRTTLRCEGASAQLVSNWGDPKKAAHLEANYQNPEVVAQRHEILALAALAPGERVLDVGCGPGLLLRDIALRVGKSGIVAGIDPSEAMISLAESRLSPLVTDAAPVELKVACVEALPYVDEAFDVVVISQVLLYLQDVPRALAEMQRVLRPGGRLVICETDWNSLVVNTSDAARFERILAACRSTFVDAHVPPKLPGLLSSAGLHICELRTVPMIGGGRADRSGGSFIGNWAFRVVESKARNFGLSESDITGWLDEQQRLSDSNAFFACVHRFLFLARKPPSQRRS